jgi:hypothetical protein
MCIRDRVAGKIFEAHAKDKEHLRPELDLSIEELNQKIQRKRRPNVNKTGIIIKGIDEALVRLAHC